MKVLLFKIDHCVNCNTSNRLLTPICNELGVDLCEMYVDEDQELMTKYDIRSVPTIIVIDDNDNELKRWTSYVSGHEFEEYIKSIM